MNVTFTKEELEKFCNALGEWNDKSLTFLVQEMARNPMVVDMGNAGEFLRKKLEAFKQTNPQPTWRSLL